MWLGIVRGVVTLALSICMGPLAADAQLSGRVVRIGILSAGNPCSAPQWLAFAQRLHELGYIEGQNLEIAFRNAEGIAERLATFATDLVQLKPDMIVAVGIEASIRAAKQATSTIPIVMVAIGFDPIALGYVTSLAKPEGNIAGMFFHQPELTGKRLQLLKEALPEVSRVAVFWDTFCADQLREAEAAAQLLGIQLQPVELRDPPYDFERAFTTVAEGGAQALLGLASPVFFFERARRHDLARRNRLPTMSPLRENTEVGALMAYGASLAYMFRRAADHVDKILKGAKPADLPVEQPTKFELVINLRTAQALGLTISPTLLFQADQVIK
jgi:putative ABC transport system substrate-binding protein